MTRVLVTHAGGRLGIGVARALKASDREVYVVGADANPYQLRRAVADERRLLPRADHPDYLAVLRDTVRQDRIDVIWANHEAEIALLAQASDAELAGARIFLPTPEVIQRCQDKMVSYECLQEAGVPAPRSMLITQASDLEQAFDAFGSPIWVRAIRGAGGKGSRAVSDIETARLWIELHKGWGSFMAAECLTPSTITWESVWHEGNLIIGQGRERLYWEFSSLTPSGVTGIAGAAQWRSDPVVDDVAERTVRALADPPHGVFSVDITYDAEGGPRVTEVNCGRFMSGGLVHFPQCGYNAADIVTRLALAMPLGFDRPVLNPCPLETVLVHGMDVEPVVTTVSEVQALESRLETQLAAVRSPSDRTAAAPERDRIEVQ